MVSAKELQEALCHSLVHIEKGTRGISSLVGELPWHYATDYLNIAYRANPQAIAARLPESLAPGPEPDMAYVAFSKWWSLWDDQPDMAFMDPERIHYPGWRDTPPVGLEGITEFPWSHLICGIWNTQTRTGSAACDVKTA
jgi:hypothetical protein